jgi:hypothetical protein
MKHGKLMPGGGHLKMPGGGRLYDYMKQGGKLKMVRNDEGDLVPFYAADGKGKMEYGGKTMRHGGMNDGEPMLVIKVGKDGMKYMQEGGKNPDEGFGEDDPYNERAKGTRDNELLNDDGKTMFNSGIEGFNPKTLGEFSSRFFVRETDDDPMAAPRRAVKLDDGTLRPISREEFIFMNKQFANNDYGDSSEGGKKAPEKRTIQFYLPEYTPNYDDDTGKIKSYANRRDTRGTPEGAREGATFNSRFDRELDKAYDTEAFDVRAAAMLSDTEKIKLGITSPSGQPLIEEKEIQEKLKQLASERGDALKRSRAHVKGSDFAAKTFFGLAGDSQGLDALESRASKIRSDVEGTEKDPVETSGAGVDTAGMQRVESPDFSTPIPSSLREETASTMNFGGRLRMANQGAKMARRTVFRFPRS